MRTSKRQTGEVKRRGARNVEKMGREDEGRGRKILKKMEWTEEKKEWSGDCY